MTKVGKRALSSLAIVAVVAGLFATSASVAAAANPPGVDYVFAETNAHRATNGQAALLPHADLNAVAQAWAEQMAADYAATQVLSGGAFRHNPNMPSQVPASWQAVGENIAVNGGFPEPFAKLMDQWKNSPGHNANMLNSQWTHMGVGVYVDSFGLTWGVQVFADYGTPGAALPTVTLNAPSTAVTGTTITLGVTTSPSASGPARVWVRVPGSGWIKSSNTFTVTNGVGSTTTAAPAQAQEYRIDFGGVFSSVATVTPVAPTLTLSAPSSAAPGTRFTLSLAVDPAVSGNATVWYMLPGGAWTASANVFTVTNGVGSTTTGAPTQATQYRIAMNGGTSNAVTVNPVVPSATLTGPTSGAPESTLTYSVALSPAVTGTATVWVQPAGGSWFATAKTFAVTNGSGSFTTAAPAGVQSYRVAVAGATSNAITVTPVVPTATLSGPTSAAPGTTMTFSVALSPSTSGTATVWVQPSGGSWFATAKTFTVTNGAGSFTTTAPSAAQSYRVAVAGATSNAVTVTPVAPTATLTQGGSSTPGGTATLQVAVSPSMSGTATVWVKIGAGEWFATAKTFAVTNGSGSTTTIVPSQQQSYRVSIAGATSNAITLPAAG